MIAQTFGSSPSIRLRDTESLDLERDVDVERGSSPSIRLRDTESRLADSLPGVDLVKQPIDPLKGY